jgi:hypothetical protein
MSDRHQLQNQSGEANDDTRVIGNFYRDFRCQHLELRRLMTGIDDERQRRLLASVLLNRLMFIYFLQRRGFVKDLTGESNPDYLKDRLKASRRRAPDQYYSGFLRTLFFKGFATPEARRTNQEKKIIGHIPYLKGALFLPHQIELAHPQIDVPDEAFENLYAFFDAYRWNLDDSCQDGSITPEVLGYVFEKHINQKAFGAYYTRPEITRYLCEQTIHNLILARVNSPATTEPRAATCELLVQNRSASRAPRAFESLQDLLLTLNPSLCEFLLDEVLPHLKLLDPACGSGAFLLAALKTLCKIYAAVFEYIESAGDALLQDRLATILAASPSLDYYIRKRIITDNLFGVDLMEEATEIAKLRLLLALVSSVRSVGQLAALPLIEFNIRAGNALVGLLRLQEETAERIPGPTGGENWTGARISPDEMLLKEFTEAGVKFEQATWDERRNKQGKPLKRPLNLSDIEALCPLHWASEFGCVLERGGGFDAIITNPPWEIFKPQAKEFFAEHSDAVTKNRMTIKEFEKERTRLLRHREVREAWLEYQSSFPHVSLYFRSSPQYVNQVAFVKRRKVGTDINLYKLFTERCFNLLRTGGECGIVLPSGICTDLGAKRLREMLFRRTEMTGLFGFENRRAIFENVDSRFKFVLLTFRKGAGSKTFPASFMRHQLCELERFPRDGSISLNVELIERLSPDSLSLVEFKSETDVRIAEKMLRFPPLGEKFLDQWNLTLTGEFHMTGDSTLFKTCEGAGRLPLYEGKMVHQFTHLLAKPRYWIDEEEGAKVLSARNGRSRGGRLDYQTFRLAFRDVARNTDSRTMLACILPPGSFAGNTLYLSHQFAEMDQLLFLLATLNSLTCDYLLRQKVTAHCNMFYVYQLPFPRLQRQAQAFGPIVERAARLTCISEEFETLARAVGLSSREDGVAGRVERARLRAELDGLIAHLYGLTEEEFKHILKTFPLVEREIKDAALEEYYRSASL